MYDIHRGDTVDLVNMHFYTSRGMQNIGCLRVGILGRARVWFMSHIEIDNTNGWSVGGCNE